MNKDYFKLTLLTIVLDLFLVSIVYLQTLTVSDICFIYNVLMVHFIFLYSLVKENQDLIDISHYNLFILLFFCPYIVTNKYILGVCLFLLFMVQFLWIVEGRCILNKEGQVFGFGKSLNISVLLQTILVSFIIGKRMM